MSGSTLPPGEIAGHGGIGMQPNNAFGSSVAAQPPFGLQPDSMSPNKDNVVIPNVSVDAADMTKVNKQIRDAVQSVMSDSEWMTLLQTLSDATVLQSTDHHLTNVSAFHQAWDTTRRGLAKDQNKFGVFMHLIATLFCGDPEARPEAVPAKDDKIWMKRYKLVRDAYLDLAPKVYDSAPVDCEKRLEGLLEKMTGENKTFLVGNIQESNEKLRALDKTKTNQLAAIHAPYDNESGHGTFGFPHTPFGSASRKTVTTRSRHQTSYPY